MKIVKRMARSVAFQLFWLACVVGGNVLAVTALIALLAFFYCIERGRQGPGASTIYLTAMAMTGLVLEAVAVYAGGVSFTGDGVFGLPYWLMVLWLGFVFTYSDLYAGLFKKSHYLLLIGAIGGPLSYFAGARLGAATLHFPAIMLLFWSALWTLMFFMLSRNIARPPSIRLLA